MSGRGIVTSRRLFGEFGLYMDGKFFACICDDTLFIKITDAGKTLLPEGETAPPYEGAKPYFVISSLEDREFLAELAVKTCEELPKPKPKKKRSKEAVR